MLFFRFDVENHERLFFDSLLRRSKPCIVKIPTPSLCRSNVVAAIGGI